jgi:hypothetical protein
MLGTWVPLWEIDFTLDPVVVAHFLQAVLVATSFKSNPQCIHIHFPKLCKLTQVASLNVFQQAEFFFIPQCSHSSMVAAKLLLMMTRVIVTF